MLYFAHKLLNEEKTDSIRKSLILSSDWVDGKTMSASGSSVKRNLQLNLGETHTKLSEEIIEILENDDNVNSFCFPSKYFNILFSRIGVGMFYGPHLDSPYLNIGRRDFSFTIFLNDPNEYKGGELILYISPEKKSIKLNKGEMIIYPTKYLHEVKEVTDGERMVCVGWIQSQIEKDEDRESLYLIQKGYSQIINSYGRSAATDNLNIGINRLHKRFLN